MIANIDNRAKYEQNTSTLKELFKKADNSGKVAWQIGDLLWENHEKRLYKSEYNTFDAFTEAEFGKTGQTARIYISIRKRFKWEDISETMLVTHLKAITDFEDSTVGNTVLKALKKVVEEEELKSPETPKILPSTKDISLSLTLLSKSKSLDEKQAVKTLKAVASYSKKNTAKKRKKKSVEDKFGNRLKSPGIPQVSEIFENEPIDEMGTVALFCVLFPFIKGVEFELDEEKLSFESLQYVRSPFPDSSIRVKESGLKNPKFKYMKVEFEFYSYNFITHNHLNDEKFNECKLIICWKDNIVGNEVLPMSVKERLPRVIELSSILEDGLIKPIDITQSERS